MGDIINLKQQQQQHKNIEKSFIAIKDDQCKPKEQQQKTTKSLLDILLNAKCIPLLPAHSNGEFRTYRCVFHLISDKKGNL